MSKKMDPLAIMNTLGKAAHKKAQPAPDMDDADDGDEPAMAGKKSSKQAAAINEKKKGYAKAPKLP